MGGFNVSTLAAADSLSRERAVWKSVLRRVKAGEMPPKSAAAPAPDLRETFVTWVDGELRREVCAAGATPGPAPLRRLNRSEYSATIRDLLNIHVNAGRALPADGAGGEGFDNAAETLFLSPIHAEKYLEAARQALEYAATDPKARARFMPARPSDSLMAEAAARKNLEAFIPRAFRRPARPEEVDRYLALYRTAAARGDSFDDALLYALRGVLISPHFLFRIEEPNPDRTVRPVPAYEVASRLSYFLWGSMPDDKLFELAANGSLLDDAVLAGQVERMLKDVKSREFAESFVEQWLNTRELGRDIKPDRTLYPAYYDADLQGAIRYEPVLFFQEILASNLSVLNLIDSKFTFLTNKLAKHYDVKTTAKLTQQPLKTDLPEGTHRGGVLGMSAVLAVSSYPQRTSPVLRGKWILESMLGTPPPPPPPNVPALEEHREGAPPKTMRERLMQHRINPVCASCHNRMDPLGFALENFDVLGKWRVEEGGKAVDATGEMPDGTRFDGVDGLKQVLLDRKDLFVKNLTSKLLGYALGRGLRLEDQCAVDQIAAAVAKDEYRAQTLIREIVFSAPFRQQAGGGGTAVSNRR